MLKLDSLSRELLVTMQREGEKMFECDEGWLGRRVSEQVDFELSSKWLGICESPKLPIAQIK